MLLDNILCGSLSADNACTWPFIQFSTCRLEAHPPTYPRPPNPLRPAVQDPRNPSNRQKLLRYNNKMEQEHGPDWRKVMEDLDAEEGAGEKVSLVDFFLPLFWCCRAFVKRKSRQ